MSLRAGPQNLPPANYYSSTCSVVTLGPAKSRQSQTSKNFIEVQIWSDHASYMTPDTLESQTTRSFGLCTPLLLAPVEGTGALGGSFGGLWPPFLDAVLQMCVSESVVHKFYIQLALPVVGREYWVFFQFNFWFVENCKLYFESEIPILGGLFYFRPSYIQF